MAVGAGLVAGPTASAQDGDPAAQPGQRMPTQGPVSAEPSAKETVPLNLVEGLIEGAPIFNGDFADPFMLATPEALFAYATNTTTANIPVVELPKGNTTDGEYLGDALPNLPAWTVKGFQWAPSVWARPDGKFVMHYTTPAPSPGFAQPRRQCISRAVADVPGGPYVDDSTEPFICPLDQGGAIDPSIFMDGDTPYLLWKSDGDCCSLPTVIYSQQLSPDGLSTAGPPNRADHRGPALGGRHRGGPVHGQGGRPAQGRHHGLHLRPLLLGQQLEQRRLRRRHRRVHLRHRAVHQDPDRARGCGRPRSTAAPAARSSS